MQLLPDRVASMLSSIGRDSFGEAVLSLFDPEYELCHCAAYVRHSAQKSPRIVVASALSAEETYLSRQLAQQWMSRDYRVDPLVADIERHAREVPDVLFVDAPASRGCTGARARMVERYYDPLGIGEEATFMARNPSRMMSISLFKRRGAARFSTMQRDQLGRMTSLMLKSVQRHAELLADHDARATEAMAETSEPVTCQTAQAPDWIQIRSEKFTRLRSALLMDGSHLTLREAEVCAYIVLGHTVLGISLILGISINTVATHRKRAYAKLNISSQTELFSICLKHCI